MAASVNDLALRVSGMRLFGRRATDAPAASRAAGGRLLDETYRRTDRILAWLLVAHLPLFVGLAFLHGTWMEVVAWGVPCVAAGVLVVASVTCLALPRPRRARVAAAPAAA